ncbi:MAG: sulfite exporter TauE/SafE family protein [Thermoanaerobaculia bacterium]
MSLSLLTLLLLTGLGAGAFGALLGLGGGIIIVPVLVLAAGVPMHTAVATSLLCVIATSSGAAWKNVAKGVANVRLGLVLEFWTVVGAIAGGMIAGTLSGSTLTTIFAIVLLVISTLMVRGRVEPELAQPEPDGEEESRAALEGAYFDLQAGREVHYRPHRVPVAMGISSAAGVLSGLLGLGGGIIQVPSLVKLCRVPMKAAAATSNFMMGVTGAASALLYYARGDVEPGVAAATVLGILGGSRAGTWIAGRLEPKLLRRIFAVVMILVAIQMLLKAKGWWPA